MDVLIQSGDLIGQHPHDVVTYTFPRVHSESVVVTQVRPFARTPDLLVTRVDDRHLRVSRGQSGVRYRIVWGTETIDIRVTGRGLFRTARDAKGDVITAPQPVYGGPPDPTTGTRTILGYREVPTLDPAPLIKGSVVIRRDGAHRTVALDAGTAPPPVPPLVRKT